MGATLLERIRPIRVLHTIGNLDRGGVETWLMRLLRRMDRTVCAMDFLALTERPGAYDEEARALGARIFACTGHQRPWEYMRNIARVIRRYGPFDIIHCHYQEYGGLVLALAHLLGIPGRIIQSHNDDQPRWQAAGTARRIYMRMMRTLIARNATVRLAVSGRAAAWIYASGDRQLDWRFLPCAIDLAPIANLLPAELIRARLGIAPETLVIGHIGRMVPQKNQALLLRAIAALAGHEPDLHLLMIGEGPLRAELEQAARAHLPAGSVSFLGSRPDAVELLPAMDAFVLTSHYEGLSVAAVEAQAAGIPCVFSDVAAPEMDLVAPLVRRVALHAPPEEWAAAIQAAGRSHALVDRVAAFETVRASPLNLDHGIEELLALYQAEAGRGRRP